MKNNRGKTARTEVVSIRMEPKLRTDLEWIARRDVRSLSSLIEVALLDYVRRNHGYCPMCKQTTGETSSPSPATKFYIPQAPVVFAKTQPGEVGVTKA